jgi:hypothetical protein
VADPGYITAEAGCGREKPAGKTFVGEGSSKRLTARGGIHWIINRTPAGLGSSNRLNFAPSTDATVEAQRATKQSNCAIRVSNRPTRLTRFCDRRTRLFQAENGSAGSTPWSTFDPTSIIHDAALPVAVALLTKLMRTVHLLRSGADDS